MSVSSWTPSPPLQPLQNHFLCFLPAARGLPAKQIRHLLMNHIQASPRSGNQKQTGLTSSRGNFEGKKESEKVASWLHCSAESPRGTVPCPAPWTWCHRLSGGSHPARRWSRSRAEVPAGAHAAALVCCSLQKGAARWLSAGGIR